MPAFFLSFLTSSGLNPKSPLATELALCYFALWVMVTVDGVDPLRSVAAEHLCRRILQAQLAIGKCPRHPDFSGLEVYTRHASEFRGQIFAPQFQHWVAGVHKDEAQFLKQTRMAREETSHMEQFQDVRGASDDSSDPLKPLSKRAAKRAAAKAEVAGGKYQHSLKHSSAWCPPLTE